MLPKNKSRRANIAVKAARYRVFISHAGDDMWLAERLADAVGDCGVDVFLDVRDIAHGDEFKSRIREEMPKCNELIDGLNVVDINSVNVYLKTLAKRAKTP